MDAEFSRLLVESQLFSPQQCEQLAARFAGSDAKSPDDSEAAAKWLVAQNLISRYQAGILLAGRPGPFLYGDYKIYDCIEQGRLKGVFRAVHTASNHPVSLYFLTGSWADSIATWKQLVASPDLVHPNLVRCWQAVDLGRYKFLVWEDLRGVTAADTLQRHGPLPHDEACRLVQLAAAGLAQLHKAGRPHGDVQPRNLWQEKRGNVKLLLDPRTDLGPLQLAEPAAEKRLARRADYLAPEFTQPGQRPDHLTDIYALGCTLYELIAGHPPFPSDRLAEQLRCHATETPPPFTGPAVRLHKTLSLMMAKDRAQRCPQVDSLVEQLARFARQDPTEDEPAGSRRTRRAFEQYLAQQPDATAVDFSLGVPPPIDPPRDTIRVTAPSSIPPPHVAVAAPLVADRPTVQEPSTQLASRLARARSKQRRNLAVLLLGTTVSLALMGAAITILSEAGPADRSPDELPGTQPANTRTDSLPAAGAQQDSVVATTDTPAAVDRLLWASPTDGEPIELDALPRGAQVFFFARTSELVSSLEGQRVLQALGPDFAAARTRWEAAAGCGFDQIEELLFGLYAGAADTVNVACVVRLMDNIGQNDLLRMWQEPVAHRLNGSTYYANDSWAYYIPTTAKQSTFVMGSVEQIKELATSGDGPPLVRREIGQLLRTSDRLRHFTLLFAPNFLFSDGQPLFTGQRARILEPLEALLGDDLKAGMISGHFGTPCYFEMRFASDIVVDRFTLAASFQARLAQLPDAIETYLAALNPHPYWRRVAFRYPAMVRFLHGQTRVGVEGNHAVVNAALPQSAAHNLVFGAEMALASQPDLNAANAAEPVAKGPQSIEDLLRTRISISFDQDSLEFAMQNVESEVETLFQSLSFEFKIVIRGEDLEAAGITRNQQIRDFEQDNQTMADVLTALVLKANPVTTVRDPSERDQKLLWVIAPDPEKPSNRIILITTRAVAEQKYQLPEAFRSR